MSLVFFIFALMDVFALIIDFALLIFSFWTMHFVSERYFIESLDHISKKLRLSSDMAGSTLMAAGSSAPELSVSLFAIFMSGHHEAIGVGTIVGSALFNILVITGTVMFIRRTSHLIWQPIFRDIIFYILSIFLLGYIFFQGELSLSGSAFLVGLYVLYVSVVYFWKRIFPYTDIENEPEKNEIVKLPAGNFISVSLKSFDRFVSPYQFAVFLVSIGLISLLSWLLVNSAVGISAALGVPEFLIGITIVAIGTSIPDLISSVIVARQGRPGMAINNAIGSNIFDILIGLGFPFLLYMLIHGRSFDLVSENLIFSVSILAGSALLLMGYFLLTRWQSSRLFGIVLLLLYAAYLTYLIISSI
ncbi:MAG: calcium/sodium antiporter [Bacteroidales bacterium]|nr:calcium/sodium antiporter [Bacteroidales bacterium]